MGLGEALQQEEPVVVVLDVVGFNDASDDVLLFLLPQQRLPPAGDDLASTPVVAALLGDALIEGTATGASSSYNTVGSCDGRDGREEEQHADF